MISKTEIEKYASSISILNCGKSANRRMRSRRIPVLKLTSIAAVLISVFIGTKTFNILAFNFKLTLYPLSS